MSGVTRGKLLLATVIGFVEEQQLHQQGTDHWASYDRSNMNRGAAEQHRAVYRSTSCWRSYFAGWCRLLPPSVSARNAHLGNTDRLIV